MNEWVNVCKKGRKGSGKELPEGRWGNPLSSSSLGLIWGRSQSSLDPKQEREAGARTLFTNRAQCVPEPTAHHALYTMLSQGYEKLDTFPKAVRQQPRHSSDSSSDSNGTTEEDEDRTEMYQPEDGRDQMCDLDSEDQAEYELVTPGGTAPSFVVEGETVYTQVFLDLQVGSYDQYNFPLPPPSRIIQIPGWLIPPNLGRGGGNDRTRGAWAKNRDSIHVYQPGGPLKWRNLTLSSPS